jgi:hypothetical protein
MKKVTLFLGTLAAAMSLNAHAALNVYDCTLVGGSATASLVVYGDGVTVKRADWMPEDGLKTVRANATNPQVLRSGDISFSLFGFQDQADMLILPAAAARLENSIKVYTYHDDDDLAVDRQDFVCTGHKKP